VQVADGQQTALVPSGAHAMNLESPGAGHGSAHRDRAGPTTPQSSRAGEGP
jgi:hypothetical protein